MLCEAFASLLLHRVYVLHQSFLLTTQPPVAGRETAGKMCRILKKTILQGRNICVYARVICNHIPAPGNSGDFDLLTFYQAKPCQKPTLRGQSVGKTAAVSPVVCSVFSLHCLFCFYNTNPSSRKHLRTKVSPDFHLTYSKHGGTLGSESK